MMQVTIKLFGTLGSKVQDYDHHTGIIADVPNHCTPADLLKDLQVPLSHVGLIIVDNRPIQQNTPLSDGMTISFFSLVSGG